MDARAQHRLFVRNHVLTGGLTAPAAARVLGLSVRQVNRLLKRYRADGPAGLVHGNHARTPAHRHARTPAHRTPDAVRARIVELATTTYALVNHAHLAELLAEREALVIPERTLRRIQSRGRRPPGPHPAVATPPQPA